MSVTALLDQRRFVRQQHRRAGRCGCGQPRRPASPGCPDPRLCDGCYLDTVTTRGRPSPWVQLTTHHSAAWIVEMELFCAESGQRLQDALEAAMELYVAETRKHETTTGV